MKIEMAPIGYVNGGRTQVVKDDWGANRCRLVLDPARFTPASVAGLDEVSHVEVLFYFHVDADEPMELGARHPRDRADWPVVGIFAQHGRMRPNRIGVSVCKLLSVNGVTLEVEGLDAVDGTPILDIKPVWSGYAPRGEFREPQWAREIMSKYWKK